MFTEIKTETRNVTSLTEPCENTFVVFAILGSNHADKTRIHEVIGMSPQNKTL